MLKTIILERHINFSPSYIIRMRINCKLLHKPGFDLHHLHLHHSAVSITNVKTHDLFVCNENATLTVRRRPSEIYSRRRLQHTRTDWGWAPIPIPDCPVCTKTTCQVRCERNDGGSTIEITGGGWVDNCTPHFHSDLIPSPQARFVRERPHWKKKPVWEKRTRINLRLFDD